MKTQRRVPALSCKAWSGCCASAEAFAPRAWVMDVRTAAPLQKGKAVRKAPMAGAPGCTASLMNVSALGGGVVREMCLHRSQVPAACGGCVKRGWDQCRSRWVWWDDPRMHWLYS